MIQHGRVMGQIAITRAFGDFKYKTININGVLQRREYLTSTPEIRMTEIDPFNDDFFIMGSDGLYDKFKSEEVIAFCKNLLT